METLFFRFSTQDVLRAVTCLAIHNNIVVPMDVVHTTIDLYSWLWTFAPPRQCDPSMPYLIFGGDAFHTHDPEMIVHPTGTIARHHQTNANSCVFVTPSFTIDEVIAGYVPPCRLRFSRIRGGYSHYIFVYREGCPITTSLRYDRYTIQKELVADVHVTREGVTFDVVNRSEQRCTDGGCPSTQNALWTEQTQDNDNADRSDRMWLGVYMYVHGEVTLAEDP
eukprot:PhF_6_TR37511/c0_g1_i1/m.55416